MNGSRNSPPPGKQAHRYGSLVINLADVFTSGSPSLSLYQERLLIRLCDEIGFSLAQKFYWENPAKLPSPAEWVCVRRIRVTPSIEQLYWLTKSPASATANNRNILRPYSESMLQRLTQGGELTSQSRPSGFTFKQNAFSKDNGGSIPHNLLIASHTESNDAYKQLCRKHKLPIHPARFPNAIPETMIRFLTEENQIVWDPFAGSGVTAAVAEQLGRRWIINERSLTYLQGAALRFHGRPCLKNLLRPAYRLTSLQHFFTKTLNIRLFPSKNERLARCQELNIIFRRL